MTLSFGLIGAGLAGPLFGGAFLQRPGGAELLAVATRHEETAKQAAERWETSRWYTDWRELIEDPEVDAVCVATPTGSHAEITIAAAEAGKHVITEKPMATTLEEADRMIAVCEKAGVQLGVIFMYRFMDTALALKRAVDEGVIGKPILGECVGKFFRDQDYYDSAAWRGTWKGEGGGSLMTQTSHTLDLLLWILGEVESVVAFSTTTGLHRIDVDDLVAASLRFTNGGLGSVISSTAIRPAEDRRLTLHGEEGTLELIGDRIARWEAPVPPPPEVVALMQDERPDRGETAARAGYVDPKLHHRQLEDFVESISTGRRPSIDGREGRRTLEVMRAIYRSSDVHEVVDLPLGGDA